MNLSAIPTPTVCQSEKRPCAPRRSRRGESMSSRTAGEVFFGLPAYSHVLYLPHRATRRELPCRLGEPSGTDPPKPCLSMHFTS